MIKKGSFLKADKMLIFRRHVIHVILVLMILFLGAIVYHNGLQINCPFCTTNIFHYDQLNDNASSHDLFIDNNAVSLILAVQTETVPSNKSNQVSYRAPPA
jgi:hypothetical protein